MNILTSPRLLEERSLFVAFAGRLGGRSSAPLDSLNVSLSAGDDARNVISNRSKLARCLGLNPASLVVCSQVHGADVLSLNEDLIGNGMNQSAGENPRADGIVTDQPGVPIMMQFADCVPVAVFDVRHKVALALHCGRAGIEFHLVNAGLDLLKTKWGSDQHDLVSFIGPSIGPCCYEVDKEVGDEFARHAGPGFVLEAEVPGGSTGSNKPHLDLWSAVKDQLKAGGIAEQNITNPAICTSCNRDRYFSHRADRGSTGRHAMIVAVLP